jgi:endonuclease YncB( thermonuclease family)
MRRTAILALALIATEPTPALADIIGRASVIDGDTIEIHGERIRLHGIDAPESGQNCVVGHEVWLCGQEAAHALDNFIGSSPVICQEQDVDRYGRIVAACSVRGTE